MIRRLALALAALAAAIALVGCGSKQDVTAAPPGQAVKLELDFFPNADHAGIYEGLANGDFRRAGLDVHVQAPSDPASPLQLLAGGKVDIAISYEPEVLLARDRGLDLVSFGALVQRPLTSVISLPKSGVRRIADLRGKTVGTAGIPYQSAYLKTMLSTAGVPPSSVREVNVGFNLVPAMLSRRVDATLGGFWNYEGVQLARQHRHPTVIPVDRAGVPTYDELVFVARAQDLRAHPALYRSFLQAMAQAMQALRADPASGVDALVKANPDLDRGLQLAAVRRTLPAFFPSGDHPFGWQDVQAWGRYGRWMQQHGLIDHTPSPRSLTNEFVPGQGL